MKWIQLLLLFSQARAVITEKKVQNYWLVLQAHPYFFRRTL